MKKIRERLALAIAESNLCAYCLRRAHSDGGENRAESSRNRRRDSRVAQPTRGPMPSSNSRAASSFSVANSPTRTSRRARAVGLSDGEIVETVANVALNIFENYMSHVARVPIDFPKKVSCEKSGRGGESSGQR